MTDRCGPRAQPPLGHHPPTAAVDDTDTLNGCWGAELRGSCNECMPDFLKPGRCNFKKKFCLQCQKGVFDIPAERVRYLPPQLLERYANTTSPSFWSKGSRVVNQTDRCKGPSLLIFKALPPREVEEAAVVLPAAIIRLSASGSSFVRFVLMHGTLVPQEAVAPTPVSSAIPPLAPAMPSSSTSRPCALSPTEANSGEQIDEVELGALPDSDPTIERGFDDRRAPLGSSASTAAVAGPSSASTLSGPVPAAAMAQPSSAFRPSMSLAAAGPAGVAADLDGASTFGDLAPAASTRNDSFTRVAAEDAQAASTRNNSFTRSHSSDTTDSGRSSSIPAADASAEPTHKRQKTDRFALAQHAVATTFNSMVDITESIIKTSENMPMRNERMDALIITLGACHRQMLKLQTWLTHDTGDIASRQPPATFSVQTLFSVEKGAQVQ